MKAGLCAALALSAAFGLAIPATTHAANERPDLIWARTTLSPITLNGVLSEPAWAQAESMVVFYAQDNGIPGSGWKAEGGFAPTDPTHATFKFLVNGNQLYMAAIVPDSSVGGAENFNFFDGLLMALKDHAVPDRPAPQSEYFYSWWTQEAPNPTAINKLPWFFGRWGEYPHGTPRTAEDIANWDAFTVVNGRSNSDTTFDAGYVVEMRFNLTPMGYDVQQVNGDIIEWNVSVYDCDWNWPVTPSPQPGHKVSANRVWWQSPWGNAKWYNQVRIHAKPSVTTTSGAVPLVGPELTIPNAGSAAAPTVDGFLTDPVWATIPGFDIRYGDTNLRNSYAGVGKWRSGQFQPTIDMRQDFVSNPGDATIKWFVKGDLLYIGFDVRDEVVQSPAEFDRWDGFIVSLNERVLRGPDRNLLGRRLTFHVAPNGLVERNDYTIPLVDSLGGEVALRLKPGTTVDELGNDVDQGYTAEMKVDLTKFGYPFGLGDRVIYPGITLLDGDTYAGIDELYGTRTWFWREYETECCPPWTFMQTGGGVAVDPVPVDAGFAWLAASPNPLKDGQTIQYRMAVPGQVTLLVYDARGRLVRDRPLGLVEAGTRQAAWSGRDLPAGLYLVQLRITDPTSGAERASLSGKAIVLR